MSLQVWLPLTKDLRNQGLNNMTFSSTNTTNIVEDSAGKLGKCYKRSTKQTTGRIISNTTINLSADFSMCCWAKVMDCVGDTANGLVSNHSHSDNTGFGITVKQVSTSDYRISCNTGTGSGRTYNTYYGTSNIKDAWHHLAITYDKATTQLKLWVDGVCEKNVTYTSGSKADYIILFDWSTTYDSTNYRPAAAMNDVRIYDHCLSPMEVKELAKGLVLHYSLNRQGWGQENLVSQYVMPGGNSPGTTSTAGRTNYYGDYGIIIPATENADTYFSIWYPEPLESGVVYTLSAEVSGLLEGSYYNFPLFAQNNTSMGIIQFNHNGLNKLTFTMNYTGTITTATVGGKTYYRMFMDDNGRAIASGQGAITIKNIKLEKGSIATPWCPNSSDTLATTMDLNSTTEYDCSGFCNNGTRIGTFTWTSDAPKYAVSQVFNGTDNAIQTPNLTTMVTDKNYTIACWTYKTVIGTKNYQTIYGGPSGFELEARSSSSTSPLYRIHNWGGGTTAYNFGEWTHFCFVHTDSDSKLYVNGELKITGTSVNVPSGNYFVGAWNTSTSQNYEGNMSDFRIYATALSADDVKSLYQNSAYIDSSGNVYGAVYNEV